MKVRAAFLMSILRELDGADERGVVVGTLLGKAKAKPAGRASLCSF
jgi:hypothetical protein